MKFDFAEVLGCCGNTSRSAILLWERDQEWGGGRIGGRYIPKAIGPERHAA